MKTSPMPEATLLEDTLDLKEIASILDAANLHAQNAKVLFLDLSGERHTIQAWLKFSRFVDNFYITLEVVHDGCSLLPGEGAIKRGIEYFRQLVEHLETHQGDATIEIRWTHKVHINEGWESPGEYVETLEYISLDDDATPTAIAPSWAARSRDWTFKESELEHSSYSNPFDLRPKTRQSSP